VQVEGVSPEEHRRLARELAERQRQCTTMELELRAALDKLEVYRWADDAAAPAASVTTSAGALTVAGMSQQPDGEKSVEELRAELEQLRQAMALQGEEAQKVSQADTKKTVSTWLQRSLTPGSPSLRNAATVQPQETESLTQQGSTCVVCTC
jgi:hypothetical protein